MGLVYGRFSDGAISSTIGNFSHVTLLPFEEAIATGEPILFYSHMIAGNPKEMGSILPKLFAMKDYPAPIMACHGFQRLPPGHFARKLGLAFDWLLLEGSVNNFPEYKKRYAGRWFKNPIPFRNRGLSFDNRSIKALYSGRAEGRRRPNWIAEIMKNNDPIAMCLRTRGASFLPLYDLFKRKDIAIMRDVSREQVERTLNNAQFLVYPTDFGDGEFVALEYSPLEAVHCGCMPILNSKWCQHLYKGYPGQVESIDHARELILDKSLYKACQEFMSCVEPMNSERSIDENMTIYESMVHMPRNTRDIDAVVEYIDSGFHNIHVDWSL